MTFGFVPEGDGAGVLVLPPWLVLPLLSSLADLRSTIASDAPEASSSDPLAELVGIEPDAEQPLDPVLARLFPDAYQGDDEAAAEFRRYTRRRMRQVKLDNADVAIETLDNAVVEIPLSGDEVQAWLRTLNDLRLATATRLRIENDEDASIAEHRSGAEFQFYSMLGLLLGLMVDGVAGEPLEPDDPWSPPTPDEPLS